jgi:hypothetical protein
MLEFNGSNIKDYQISITEGLRKNIASLSERYLVSESKFVEILLKFRLEEIESDIGVKEYVLIENYLEMRQERENDQGNEKNLESKLKITFSNVVDKAVRDVCNLIKWTPEQFIENTLDFWIEELNRRVDDGELGFLVAFLDFQPALKSIEKALEGGY